MQIGDLIFHISSALEWSRRTDAYRGDTLASEGFIHCSRAHQVLPVANAIFAGREDLVLLSIACDQVSAEIRDENLEGGTELFPHIYGAVEMVAVVSAEPLELLPDGSFATPPGLQAQLAQGLAEGGM